jgi:hypothetical protein
MRSTASRGTVGGPHPGVLALVSLTLTLVGLLASGAMSAGDTLSSPFAGTVDVVARVRDHHDAVRVAAFFQFGSAIPLVILAATVYARQLRLGVRVPGPVIGLVGGVLAAVSLLVSSFATYVESRPEITTEAQLVHALAFLSFVAGGPGYVVGLGLLIAGIAVPAFILRLVPRWLAATGLAIAVLAELTWFSLLLEPVQYLLPVGRFLGGLWLVAAGFTLPLNRHQRGDA